MKTKISRKRFYKFLLYLIGLFIFIRLYYFLFLECGIVIPCMFHRITGFYCPGCGVTRMLSSFAKLEFYQAFRYNPLLFIASPFVLLFLIDIVIKWLCQREDYFYKRIDNKGWIVLLIVVILYGILRNIPSFDYLIPTVI